jgi:hypothetical protein
MHTKHTIHAMHTKHTIHTMHRNLLGVHLQ